MILQRGRRAEHRHDAVAGETADRAAVPLHHHRRTIDQFGHDLAQPLRTDRCRNVHRMNNIGEQHRYLLVLRRSSGVCERCTALVTELGVGRQFGAARPTEQPRRGQSTPPSPLGSTSVSFHRWSTMSVISPCHLRHEVSRLSNVVCFKTPVFGPYHADLSSLRRLGVMAVAAPVLEQLTLAVAGFVVFVTGMIAVAAHHETATLSSHCCRNKKPQG